MNFILRIPFICWRICVAIFRRDTPQLGSYGKVFKNAFAKPIHFCLNHLLLGIYLFKIKLFKRPVILLITHRIGHLALNTEIFLKRMRNWPEYAKKFKKYYCITECHENYVANSYLYNRYKKFLPIIKNEFVRAYLRENEINLTTSEIAGLSVHSYRELVDYSATDLSFSKREHREAQDFLSRYNFDLNKNWYVCVFARDAAYLKNEGA